MQVIPKITCPIFQECTFEHLDPHRDSELVIECLFADGNRVEVGWLLRQYGQRHARGWLSEISSRQLPRRRYRLRCGLLDVSENSCKSSPI